MNIGQINDISLRYVPGIGMQPKQPRPPAPPKPILAKSATRAIAVLRTLTPTWTSSDTIRKRTNLENGSRCATVLCILRNRGFIETRKVPLRTGGQSAEHRLTPAGQREQAAWEALL